ncbi:dephospho-CoA kinase [Reichenbachiella agarivorans]|uniref:Dephospho-CoA kinase n=1 Tax=Reichenbachiella agarivorans TaxID=2979464 RepID=A0ABY6CUX9_9BACT|nr:dephospho-CoA kinase [Reichenbachiella agarivorans]UXP33805.1 dephospho-CoA kinase [Reichenbachiella agarivorans]
MKKIGVTGGIGSGKSTVCEIFRSLGIPTYDADTRAKALMNENPLIKTQIIAAFGEEAYQDGVLNRAYLADQVFTKGENTQVLNSIVHPAVGKDFEAWASEQNSPYVIKEAALLIESGSYQSLDALINVTSPMEIRIARIKKRDSFRSEEEIKGIINKQLSDEERNRIADYILHNDEQQLLIPQVLALHEKFL